MTLTIDPAGMLEELFPDMVAWRRHLHRNPELSYKEERTSSWIAAQLRSIGGCEVREAVGGYGVIASFRGSARGPAVALRADIDALPIRDEKTVEYASTVEGAMHACGHDAHTAALLAVARCYAGLNGAFAGERRLLFQPAEEVPPGGARAMIEAGALEGVDAIYGVHLWTPLPFGTVATRAGAFMAAADEYTIEITGRGGHGGLPHETVDAIVAGSAVVQAVQTVVSRNVSPLQPAVVSIGTFHAGTAENVVAERCEMKGTMRTFDAGVRDGIRSRLARIVADCAAVYGAEGKLTFREGYPPVVNDAREAERFFRVAEASFGSEAVRESDPIMAGEDFSFYLNRVPGCFMFVGAGGAACGAVYPHHHPRFDLDERAMLKSARLLIAMAEDYAEEAVRMP